MFRPDGYIKAWYWFGAGALCISDPQHYNNVMWRAHKCNSKSGGHNKYKKTDVRTKTIYFHNWIISSRLVLLILWKWRGISTANTSSPTVQRKKRTLVNTKNRTYINSHGHMPINHYWLKYLGLELVWCHCVKQLITMQETRPPHVPSRSRCPLRTAWSTDGTCWVRIFG